MRKVFYTTLGLIMSVGLVNGQTANEAMKKGYKAYDKTRLTAEQNLTSPVRLEYGEATLKESNKKEGEVELTEIGATVYDLQTNGSVARRIKVYEDGKISAVWTSSLDEDPYPARGTGYNHYNGTSWGSIPTGRIEPERCGWPNIGSFDEGGSEKEYLITHIAKTTGESGGYFYSENGSIGSSNWTSIEKEKEVGPIWFRTATDGNGEIHMIGTYPLDESAPSQVTIRGVERPTVYYKYNPVEDTFAYTQFMLPGYDSSKFTTGVADAYAIDAQDSTVAILYGWEFQDLTLWKSTDYGNSWTKTILMEFPIDAYDPDETTFFDTTEITDGNVSVVIDQNGTVHCAWGEIDAWRDNLDGANVSFAQPRIMYWNDEPGFGNKVFAGGAIDRDGDQTLNISQETLILTLGRYGNGGIATHPNITTDEDGNIFIAYTAALELTASLNNENYRDIYIVHSDNGGNSWSEPQNITDDTEEEQVFPALAKYSDDYLYLTYQQDIDPGTAVGGAEGNQNIASRNDIVFAKVEKSAVINEEIGVGRLVGLEENEVITSTKVYPNPADQSLNLDITLEKNERVNVQILNSTGQIIRTSNLMTLPAGLNTVNIDIDDLSAGVYLMKISNGSEQITKRVVVR